MLKGKRRDRKRSKLSSLEKIQLHINKIKGLPSPKVLPKLTDEEYLVFQSKLTDLKNVNIGISKFGAGEPPPLLNQSYKQTQVIHKYHKVCL